MRRQPRMAEGSGGRQSEGAQEADGAWPGYLIVADESDTSAHRDPKAGRDPSPSDGPALLGWVPKLGVWAWSFVGFVVAMIIVVTALGAMSEIVLPLTFAAVLAVVFKPLVDTLVRHRFKPTLAAGLVVLGLLALMAVVVVATVRGVTEQTDQIGASVDAALDKAAEQTGGLGIDKASLDQARAATEDAEPMVTGGVLTRLVAGIGKLVGLASGLILGALIMHYLLKDGTRLRRAVVAQVDPRLRAEVDGFIGDAIGILRDYGRGRTVMSAIVSVVIGLAALLLGLPLVFTIMVVNFIGGYIPLDFRTWLVVGGRHGMGGSPDAGRFLPALEEVAPQLCVGHEVEVVRPDGALQRGEDGCCVVVGALDEEGLAVAPEADGARAGPRPQMPSGCLEARSGLEAEAPRIGNRSEHQVTGQLHRRLERWGLIGGEVGAGELGRAAFVGDARADHVLDSQAPDVNQPAADTHPAVALLARDQHAHQALGAA